MTPLSKMASYGFLALATFLPGLLHAQANPEKVDLDRLAKDKKYRKQVVAEFAAKASDAAFVEKIFGPEEYQKLAARPFKVETKIQGFNGTEPDGKHLPLQMVVGTSIQNQTKETVDGIEYGFGMTSLASKIITDTDGNGEFNERDKKQHYYLNRRQIGAGGQLLRDKFALTIFSDTEFLSSANGTTEKNDVHQINLALAYNEKTGRKELQRLPTTEEQKQGNFDKSWVMNGEYQPEKKLADLAKRAVSKFHSNYAGPNGDFPQNWNLLANIVPIPSYGAPPPVVESPALKEMKQESQHKTQKPITKPVRGKNPHHN